MLKANECREHAKRCVTMAAEARDPVVRERLSDTAQGWARLASQLLDIEQMEKCRDIQHRRVA
jgi:hypothetical protein